MHHHEFNRNNKEEQRNIIAKMRICVVTYTLQACYCQLMAVEDFFVEMILDKGEDKVITIKGINPVHLISLYQQQSKLI